MTDWIIPAFLGLGLSAATGLRTFLPLLMLAIVARLGWFGMGLNPHLAWIASTPSLVALGVATVAELAADKIPGVDHALAAFGTFTRPAAGALATGAVFAHADPAVAAIAGLVIGVPTALAFHAAQTGTRLASTGVTAGLGNPIISLVEDGVATGLVALSFLVPMLGAFVVAGLLFLGFRLRDRLSRQKAPTPPANA